MDLENLFSLYDLIENESNIFKISNGRETEYIKLDSVAHANYRGHNFNYSYYLSNFHDRLFYLVYDIDIELNYNDYVKQRLNDNINLNDYELRTFLGAINSTVLLALIDNEETIKQFLKFESVVINYGSFHLEIKPITLDNV